MLVSQLKNAGLCRNVLHQLECLTIRGSHQAVLSRQSSLSPPSAHLLVSHVSAPSTVPYKHPTICDQYAGDSLTHTCIGRNNVAIIGDRINSKLNYECPKTPGKAIEINTPSSVRHIVPLDIPGLNESERLTPGLDVVEKLASNEAMRQRRRSMKKHRRQRTLKKIWPIKRKIRFLKMKKKLKIRAAVLAKIKEDSEKLDAFEEIKDKLEYAKTKGFYINIFRGEAGSKFVSDIRKKREIEELKSSMQSALKAGRES